MAKMERASYQLILQKYKARGKGNVRLTQSSLILFQPIQTNTKTYLFPVLQSDNQTPAQAEEVRLNLNDEFVSYEVGYYINFKQRDAAGLNNTNLYLTYAPTELGAAAQALNAAWDAKMTIDVNGIKRLENWDMLKHRCTPRTQFQDFSVGIPSATQPSLCLGNDGTAAMQPMLTFTGAKKNEITLSLNSNIPAGIFVDWLTKTGALVNTATNLVLVFRGMLGQNAAKFQ